MYAGTYGGLKGASHSLGWGSSGRLIWVLRTKFWSSVIAADALNHQIISAAPSILSVRNPLSVSAGPGKKPEACLC